MGCDIHMYVEYKPRIQDSNWRDFGKRINPGRNYFMFGILAGVRSEPRFSFEPKGLPTDIASEAEHDNHYYISEDEDLSDESDYVTLEKAQAWAKHGRKIINHNGKPWKVENPDWHTHSWLSLEEYRKALEFYSKEAKEYPEPEYEALLAAMEKLSEFDNDVRIVFWFDN